MRYNNYILDSERWSKCSMKYGTSRTFSNEMFSDLSVFTILFRFIYVHISGICGSMHEAAVAPEKCFVRVENIVFPSPIENEL